MKYLVIICILFSLFKLSHHNNDVKNEENDLKVNNLLKAIEGINKKEPFENIS